MIFFPLENLVDFLFQSPRSGKFVSDPSLMIRNGNGIKIMCFNPLDRGNLYRMTIPYIAKTNARALLCFNPLDRGNLYLMYVMQRIIVGLFMKMFQSPRSGKFVSDSVSRVWTKEKSTKTFQSPRSGKFVSDAMKKQCLI